MEARFGSDQGKEPRHGTPAGAVAEFPDWSPATPQALSSQSQAWLLAWMLKRTAHPFGLADFEGRLLFANQAFADLLGYSLDELLALSLAQITPKHWLPVTLESLKRLRATGKTEHYEKQYVRKDGSLVPVEVVVELYCDAQDRPQGYFAFITDVTDRKLAERALRESEERFRRMYDEAPVGYHEIDTDGMIVSVNRTECEMLGFAPEEMLGRPIFDFVAENERAQSRRAVEEKMQGLRPLEPIERRYRTHDGRELVLAIGERLKFDAEGRVVGIRSTVQDITAKKRAEEALVASERRARALFEAIDDAVLVHDVNGNILDINPAACRMLGYSRDQLLRMNMREIEEAASAQRFEARLQEQLQRGRLTFEASHRASDARAIPVEVNASVLWLEGEQAVLAVIRDITERKALEDTRRQLDEARLRTAQEIEAKNLALIESEARYRRLTEGSLDPVVVSDAQGLITLFNPAAERAFGYEAVEVVGQSLTMLMPPEFRRSHEEAFHRFVATRQARLVGRTVELVGLRKNGAQFPLELSLNAVDVAGQLQFIGAMRDQTERNRMRAVLMQTEKLASIGLLSAGVAHEINNPLSYVGNNLAVLDRDVRGMVAMLAAYDAAKERLETAVPEVVDQVERISDELDWPYVRDNLDRMLTRTREGVQRVANIVSNLRGLARTAPPKMEEANLGELVASALEMVQGRLRRSKIEVQTDLERLEPLVCVPAQINQVVLNLLVNAIQAIESAHGAHGGLIDISARREGDFYVLTVCDNGGGIDPDHLPRLFDPFFTTKPVGEGTGLGLSITHGIVTGHGGRIEVESEPGDGTCFAVYLPRKGS